MSDLPLRANTRAWHTLSVRLLFMAIALFGLSAFSGLAMWAMWKGLLWPYLRQTPPLFLVLAMIIYLTGHVFRILRLAMLIGGWRVGFRMAASFHLFTAAVSLLAPMKLGELYRVGEMSNLVGSLPRSFVIVLWERIFDVLAILCLIVLLRSLSSGDIPSGFVVLTLLSLATLAAAAVVFFVLPDGLRRLSLMIILRYNSPSSVWWLRQLASIRQVILEAPIVVRGKFASLLTLTAMAWLCEVASVAVTLPQSDIVVENALTKLISFFAALSTGETLLTILLDKQDELSTAFIPHIIATQVPLAFLGLLAGLYYAFKAGRGSANLKSSS